MTIANKEDVLTNEELGFAGKLADSFIHSPLSPLLFLSLIHISEPTRQLMSSRMPSSA